MAGEELGEAACVGAGVGLDGLLVEGLVDGFEAVGVVVGDGWVGECLAEEVDAAVYDAEGVQVDVERFTHGVGGAVRDALVLFFKEGGDGGAVAATVLDLS